MAIQSSFNRLFPSQFVIGVQVIATKSIKMNPDIIENIKNGLKQVNLNTKGVDTSKMDKTD